MSEATYRLCSIVVFTTIVVLIVGVLGTAILTLPAEASGLKTVVEASLDQSGVKNPVTAVLLNFRGYDTMLGLGLELELELVVMLLAVIGARALTNGETWYRTQADVDDIDPLPHAMVLTGIVVAVSATALAFALLRRYYRETGSTQLKRTGD